MNILISGMISLLVLLAGCNPENDNLRGIAGTQEMDKSRGQHQKVNTPLLISPSQSGQVFELKIGQVISIPVLSNDMTWQVDYEHAIIRNITPDRKMSFPGPEGWLFQAVREGETQLMMTGFARQGSQNTMAASAGMRMTFILKVIK